MHRWDGKEATREVGGHGFKSSRPRAGIHVKKIRVRAFREFAMFFFIFLNGTFSTGRCDRY